MTRDDRLAKQEAEALADLQALKHDLAKIQAKRRVEARKARHQRHITVGTLADEAGLFVWEDTTLAGLFACLATLKEATDPVAVLQGLLSEPHCTAVCAVEG